MRHGIPSDPAWVPARQEVSSAAPSGGVAAPDPRIRLEKLSLFPELKDRPIPWIGGTPAQTRTALEAIADAMVGGTDDASGLPPSPVPAGYTYLGQFIFHDMVFSRLMRRKVSSEQTLALDLSSVYGTAPAFEPHIYETPPLGAQAQGRCRFLVGATDRTGAPPGLTDAMAAGTRDLPRLDTSSGFPDLAGHAGRTEPLIADPRNDDHLILSQIHVQFLRLHNGLVDILLARGLAPDAAYSRARRLVTGCYRHAVLNDYLARLLDPAVLELLRGDDPHPFGADHDIESAPIEFTFALSRFGHAMVRGDYRINALPGGGNASIGLVMQMSSSRPPRQVPIPAQWAVDFALFFGAGGTVPQSARRIGPFLTETIARRPLSADEEGVAASILLMDLWRCYTVGLPSGQLVAEAVRTQLGAARPGHDVTVLSGAQMLPTPAFKAAYGYAARKLEQALNAAPGFLTATPLFYYILQEAAALGEHGARLGPVGSWILAHTMAHALPRPRRRADDAALAKAVGVSTFADLIGLTDRRRVSEAELFYALTTSPGPAGAGQHRRTGSIGS